MQSIKTKLAQAGVQGRPSAAPLPWFDLQGSPLDFSLSTALAGKPVNAETLEELGMQVGALYSRGGGWAGDHDVCFLRCCRAQHPAANVDIVQCHLPCGRQRCAPAVCVSPTHSTCFSIFHVVRGAAACCGCVCRCHCCTGAR